MICIFAKTGYIPLHMASIISEQKTNMYNTL